MTGAVTAVEELSMFEKIISLNKDRILSRLRSKHAKPSRKNKGRKAVMIRLAEAITAVCTTLPPPAIPNINLKHIQEETEKLNVMFSQIEAMSMDQARSPYSNSLLIDLLKGAHVFSLRGPEILTGYSEKCGNMAAASLHTTIGKLGRYYSACSFLIRAALRLPIFKNITVEGEKVGSLSPDRLPPLGSAPAVSLSETLQRVLTIKTQTETKKAVENLEVILGISFAAAEVIFLKQLATSQKNCKVHAEIQLIFYYELHPERIPPRVICSSKSACFLCNLFNKLFGKYFIARTHGVLYDQWVLPDLGINYSGPPNLAMATIFQRLNAALEEKIQLALESSRMRRHHPNESVFIRPAVWTPSLQSQVTAGEPQPPASASDLKNPQAQQDSRNLVRRPGYRSTLAGEDYSTDGDLINAELPYSSWDKLPPCLPNAAESPSILKTSSVFSPKQDKEDRSGFNRAGNQQVKLTSSTPQISCQEVNSIRKPSVSNLRTKSPPENNGVSGIESLNRKIVEDELEGELDRIRPGSPSFHGIQGSESPSLSDDDSATYEQLVKGSSIRRKITGTGRSIRLSTRKIHITLSLVGNVEKTSTATENTRPLEKFCVMAKWLRDDEKPKISDGNMIEAGSIEEGLERISTHGAAISSTPLYIVHKKDVLAVKYARDQFAPDWV